MPKYFLILAGIFLFIPVLISSQEQQDLPKIVIAPLEPTDEFKANVIEKQAESIAAILESSMAKYAAKTYGDEDAMVASATVEKWYVADYTGGLRIFDISTPGTASLYNTVPTSKAYGVAISGDYYLVADYGGGLLIIDITKPGSAAAGICQYR